MIIVKNKVAIQKMAGAGKILSGIFKDIKQMLYAGISTSELDAWIEKEQQQRGLVSRSKGYKGYRHVSCISLNDEIVHGIPSASKKLVDGDLVKIDVCASWKGYCADMARSFIVGNASEEKKVLVDVAQQALDAGIEMARVGNKVSDISAVIQSIVEKHRFAVIRDFAGHGIGKSMHEEPEILNYGQPGKGAILRVGMTLAIEPMITAGDYHVTVDNDGWTARTVDRSLSAHIEDTVLITEHSPRILTRDC